MIEHNDNNTPRISVIIPSFNQGQFIAYTLDSLLRQNYPALEIIVIDGGSTDNTIEILQSYGDQIRWISEKDGGQTQAINKGFRLCSGDVCGYLNSDDYLLPGSLNAIADAFNDTATQWVTGDYLIVDENNQVMQSGITVIKRFIRRFSSYSLLLVINSLIQPGTFWRHAFMNTIGEFNEELRYVMDYEYWLRAYQLSKPKILKTAISAFRIHKNSKSGSQYRQQFDEELLIAKRYTNNRLFTCTHQILNHLIVAIYEKIK